MNNFLKFIRKYGNFLVFLVLEVVAFLLIGNFNNYPHSKFLSTSNTIAGWQYEQISNVRNFFGLRSVNESLAAENASLRSQLDRLQATNLFYIPAQVVEMTLFEERNYLTINRGTADSLQRGQGVCNADGAVGIVCMVNTHYSIVIPIINTESNISCRFLKNDYLGSLTWDGVNPDYAYLEDVAAHIPAAIGDTIVTSGLTPAFPKGIPVGIVENIQLKEGDSYYTIRVHLAADFRKINYIYVIQNTQQHLTDDVE